MGKCYRKYKDFDLNIQWTKLDVSGSIASTNFNNLFVPTTFTNHVYNYKLRDDYSWVPPIILAKTIMYKGLESSTGGWSFGCPNFPNRNIELTAIYTENVTTLPDNEVYLHDVRMLLITV